MAYDSNVALESFPAAADLSASWGCAVEINSSGQIALVGAGENSIGILVDKPAAAGRAGGVMTSPGRRVTAKSGSALATKGAALAADSTGRMVAATSGAYILGYVETTAGGANQYFTMLWQPSGRL